MKKKDLTCFFVAKVIQSSLSLSASVGHLSKGRTDIGQTFQELINSNIISVFVINEMRK